MRIYTKVVLSWDGTILEQESYEYAGPVALCKGDNLAKSAEASQVAFDQQLQGIFSKQFANQQSILQSLQSTLNPVIQNAIKGQGYDPATLNAMRTQATDTDSAAFQNAQRTLQNNLNKQNGGSDLPSGVSDQFNAALLNQEAQQKAGDQNAITVNNAATANSNLWKGIDALNGVATTENPLGYAGTATSGGGTVSNLSDAVTQSSGPTFGSILGGVVGAGLGAAGSYFGAKK